MGLPDFPPLVKLTRWLYQGGVGGRGLHLSSLRRRTHTWPCEVLSGRKGPVVEKFRTKSPDALDTAVSEGNQNAGRRNHKRVLAQDPGSCPPGTPRGMLQCKWPR